MSVTNIWTPFQVDEGYRQSSISDLHLAPTSGPKQIPQMAFYNNYAQETGRGASEYTHLRLTLYGALAETVDSGAVAVDKGATVHDIGHEINLVVIFVGKPGI